MILPMPTNDDLAHPLTPREIAILRLVSQGQTYREIAEEFGCSRNTVKTHKARIFAKLNVHNSAAAVAWAFRAGLIT